MPTLITLEGNILRYRTVMKGRRKSDVTIQTVLPLLL